MIIETINIKSSKNNVFEIINYKELVIFIINTI